MKKHYLNLSCQFYKRYLVTVNKHQCFHPIYRSDTEEERDERTKDEQVGASSSRELMRNIPPHMMQPLFQSSPQPSRRRSRDHDDNFLIVSENNVENVQHEIGDLTLTLQALQKQVDFDLLCLMIWRLIPNSDYHLGAWSVLVHSGKTKFC